jgi:hypothetical protein
MEMPKRIRPKITIFPARKLKPYAQPVDPARMEKGRVYFALQYLDYALFVPFLEPLIFLGFNLDRKNPDIRFFQGYESYIAGVRYKRARKAHRSDFHLYGPDEGKHIFDYEHALEGLMSCALRRQQASAAKSAGRKRVR